MKRTLLTVVFLASIVAASLIAACFGDVAVPNAPTDAGPPDDAGADTSIHAADAADAFVAVDAGEDASAVDTGSDAPGDAGEDTGADAAGSITEFLIKNTPSSEPTAIVAGPDGNLWFTEYTGNKIGMITTAGFISEYPVPTSGASPNGITLGPDQNLWFVESEASAIGKITTGGQITQYTVSSASSLGLTDLATGSDGNLWFTEGNVGKLGSVSTAGVPGAAYTIATGAFPWAIVKGPDGNLWFSTQLLVSSSPLIFDGALGVMTASHTFTTYDLPDAGGEQLFGVTVGPDGNLWFADKAGSNIVKVTTSGQITLYPVTPNCAPYSITTGPDGAMWFTEVQGNKIGRITTDGKSFSEFQVPTAPAFLEGITTGPDGNIWFTEWMGNKIGRLVP